MIPPQAATQDAEGFSSLPFGSDGLRMQQLIDGSAVCTRSATLREVAMRRDASSLGKYRNRTFWPRTVSLTLRIGLTDRTLRSMSDEFEANWSYRKNIVYNGSYNLPRMTPVATPVAPFQLKIKFTQPFVFVCGAGNLLLEYELHGDPAMKHLYSLDAEGVVGQAFQFGDHGPYRGASTGRLTADPSFLIAGGLVDLEAWLPLGDSGAPLAVVALGQSRTTFRNARLPFDLTRHGAPGNALYVSIDVAIPLPITFRKGRGLAGFLRIPVPARPGLQGARAFAQAIYADPASNALGLVFSNALVLHVARGTMPRSRCLFAANGSVSFGRPGFTAGLVLGGPVVQLAGSFN